MLLYSTILDINDKMTKDVFIGLVIEWNQGSPYEENIIKGISWNGERNVRFGDDKLWLEIIEYRNKNIVAVRYEKITEDGAIWDTEYIMNFDEMRMAVRLERSYVEDAVVTNEVFSTPHFITLLINGGYIKSDNGLDISLDALEITKDNITMIADVVNGKTKYQLPIVYVSKTASNKNPVDINMLCKRLKGIAHVFLQNDKQINAEIRELCGNQNEYNGAIGIYYPNDALGHKRLTYKEKVGNQLLLKVVNFVLEYGVLQNVDKLYTWQGVSNSLLYDRLVSQKSERLEAEKAKEKAENEVEDVYANFDEELKNLERKVRELTRALDVKENDIRVLRGKLAQMDEKPIVFYGAEEELYPGEIKDILLGTIEKAISDYEDDSRRKHVLEDLLDSNNYERLSDKRKNEIKNLLKGYTRMTSSLRSSLQNFGFEITEEGKHYKLTYENDPRYMTMLAKTPSDHYRGDKNVVTEICRKFL